MARIQRVEDLLRERVFLPVNEAIDGIEVARLNLDRLLVLIHTRSAFLSRTVPFWDEVALFLWVVQPGYRAPATPREARRAISAQRAFGHEVSVKLGGRRYFNTPTPQFRRLVRAIERYLDRTFLDLPPALEGGGGSRVAASFPAVLVHLFGVGNRDRTMQLPLAELLQYIPLIALDRAAEGSTPAPPKFSYLYDRAKQRFLEHWRALPEDEKARRIAKDKARREAPSQ